MIAPMTDDSLHLVQITDCHLLAEPDGRLRDVDTQATLAAVVERVRAEAPDVVLATGDLSQDGTPASYRRFKALAGRLGTPVHCLPGNHDHPATLAGVLPGDGIHVGRQLVAAGWQIIFLDSTIAGEDDGELAAAELSALDAALGGDRENHALVCLHHHPLAVGGAWRDFVSLANPDALFAVLDRHPRVRGLLWGHIHQPFDGARGALRLMATPSTCFQFKRTPGGELGIADDPPGYRSIRLHADGGIETEVRWLEG
jgi:Icc protein